MTIALIGCGACGTLVKVDGQRCPHCGAGRSRLTLAAGAIVVGMTLAGCPADDSEETATASATVADSSASGTMSSSTGDESLSATSDDPTTSGPEPAYGVGTTTFTPSTTGGESGTSSGGAATDTGTGGDTGGSTGLQPMYGAAE